MKIAISLRSTSRLLRLITCLCCGAAPAIGMAQDASAWIGPANNAFAADLYAKLAAGTKENLFFSPDSIQAALTMTYAGARGKTAGEMAAVLHLPPKSTTIQEDFGNYLKELTNTGEGGAQGYQLSVANALWGQKGYGFLPDFLSLLKTNYGAGLEQVDFKGDSEGARNTINAWVEKETAGKIKDLIGPRALTAATRLVLTNAVYFKGTWAAPFDKTDTRDEPFHLADGREKSVQMMHRTARYGYMEGADFQALKLGYAGNRLSMIILLPRKRDGLPGLESVLTAEKLKGLLEVLSDKKVVVSLPKFKMTDQFDLVPTLESMGMETAFGKYADFSGMTGKPDIGISAVVHKAFVEVNEEGTEAAAATGVVATMEMAMPSPVPVFRADHPFVFVISDETSGAFLFMGRVMEPN